MKNAGSHRLLIPFAVALSFGCGGATANDAAAADSGRGADAGDEASSADAAAPSDAFVPDVFASEASPTPVKDASSDHPQGCSGPSDCPSGEACNGNQCTTSCDSTHSCNGGCCLTGVCFSGDATGACGSTGGACVTCQANTQNCSGGACVSIPCGGGNSWCPTGYCCSGDASDARQLPSAKRYLLRGRWPDLRQLSDERANMPRRRYLRCMRNAGRLSRRNRVPGRGHVLRNGLQSRGAVQWFELRLHRRGSRLLHLGDELPERGVEPRGVRLHRRRPMQLRKR